MQFDPAAATAAYIDGLGAENLARALAYTTGGHWLLLWSLLVSGLVCWVIVRMGILERVESRFGARGTGFRAFVVGVVYFLCASLIGLPWSVYSSWWRERSYGRTAQPLGDYLMQSSIGVLLGAVLGALFFMGVFALMRRTGRRWWIWSAGMTAVSAAVLILLAPIVIEPIFNDYRPIPPGEVRDAIVVLAKSAGVPEDRIFVYDGSRQSNNFTANAGGIGGSARIAVSDIAWKGASLDEVKAVTGHEIGHYVLGHTWRGVALITVLAVLFFFLIDRLFPRFAGAFGSRATLDSPVGLPVMLFMAALFGLLGTPVMNAFGRYGETEADRYSLRNVDLPDALASALVKTAEYRYPRPGALEEAIFYDHPSVERRVRMGMEWKAAHPPR
ncbi:MAG: M48 family metallopeptidase [Gemmatimonadetes bacterium]|nr:M48 family metallopeptidase [Gemmatimonadota bacterium]